MQNHGDPDSTLTDVSAESTYALPGILDLILGDEVFSEQIPTSFYLAEIGDSTISAITSAYLWVRWLSPNMPAAVIYAPDERIAYIFEPQHTMRVVQSREPNLRIQFGAVRSHREF